MLYGLFYMINSALGRNDLVKRFADACQHRYIGQEQKRKAEHELAELMRDKPTYSIPDELKKVKP